MGYIRVETIKFYLLEIREMITRAQEKIGEVDCTHRTNLARAMIEFNRLVNEEVREKRNLIEE